MSNFFEKLNDTYHDPNTPEFDKGVALGKMQEMCNQTHQWNKKNNPEKYHADEAKKAEQKAEYHKKQAAVSNNVTPVKSKKGK